MPRRLKRYYGNDDLHFITFSCYHCKPKLHSPILKDLFLETLEYVRARYQFAVLGYDIMPEHVHLFLGEPPTSNLSTVIQVMKQTVSRKVSLQGSRASVESFWQSRFYDFNVHTEAKRGEKLRYMHRNPVTRGLVAKPEDWTWSSFRFYATGQPSVVPIDSSWLNRWRMDVEPTLRKSAKDGTPAIRLE